MDKFFLIVTLFIFNFSFGQNNMQNISGVVTDKLSQTALRGASVQITSLQKNTVADSLGNYLLSNIPPNRYDIDISYTGYKTVTIPLSLIHI